ncbi:dsRNA-binding protein, putative [Bodo saltans]|uniref:DsRNA-binding protein, putative n=1 Tax=Bodo saltans TaxID=75058 RepID=A0A0S4JVJ3_BODSA|nr:dsRNA-binding protein, putative [Bodo saltans]|eukprot:CUG94064.1 dsRNA-binding protein, putative [Bodo saltans]
MSAAPAATTAEKDTFRYPLPLGDQNVTLPNSLSWIRGLYEDAGRIKKSRETAAAAPTGSSLPDDELLKSWFTHKTKVVPGDVLTLVESITFPTPKGMQTVGRPRVEFVFDRRYLLEMEESDVLKLYSYIELDQMRFAYVAMMDLVDAGKVFGPDGQLTGLAKRDIKKNCGEKSEAPLPASSSTAPAASAIVASSGAAPSAGGAKKPAAVQKFLRGVLEDECILRWPHTPVAKSCIFKVEQDPSQPRNKPLFQATVELTLYNKRSFKGEWVSNKRDAESSAADIALRALVSGQKR